MWNKIKKFYYSNQTKIRLLILVFLLTFLAFGAGYLFGRYRTQEPLEILEDLNL